MKILVVDDDDIALAVIKKILETEPYEVLLAEDGESALEILRSTDIQIVISDWNMPKITDEMSGIDDLLRNADRAMYRAKAEGRNRVVATDLTGDLARCWMKPVSRSQKFCWPSE